jgi:hypothetical protein
MSNCGAASLYHHAKKKKNKTLNILNFKDDDTYKKFYSTKNQEIIEAFKSKNISNLSFEFVRFIIYTDKQEECLGRTVFPSLKASQDLFRIKSFFFNKKGIKAKLNNRYNTYEGAIKTIWGKFLDDYPREGKLFKKRINERINEKEDNIIPEFLLLFKDENGDCPISIHTYVNGKPYNVKIEKSDTTHIDIIKVMLSLLAECYVEQDKSNSKPSCKHENLNTQFSYICWEDEEDWKNQQNQANGQ